MKLSIVRDFFEEIQEAAEKLNLNINDTRTSTRKSIAIVDVEGPVGSEPGLLVGYVGHGVVEMDNIPVSVMLASDLKGLGMTASVAESCTGGLLGGALTDIEGSSAFFKGGIIAYADSVKVDMLGVSPESLSAFGAVSPEVAIEMAVGAKSAIKSECGISVTGIAGPSGGTETKPVGTIFIGVAAANSPFSISRRFNGSRWEVRAQSVRAAIGTLWAHLRYGRTDF